MAAAQTHKTGQSRDRSGSTFSSYHVRNDTITMMAVKLIMIMIAGCGIAFVYQVSEHSLSLLAVLNKSPAGSVETLFSTTSCVSVGNELTDGAYKYLAHFAEPCNS